MSPARALRIAPYALLAVAAGVLAGSWGSIPDRFAVQWGLDGEPTRFVRRSPLGVYLPIAIGLAVSALLRATARFVRTSARSPADGHGSTERVLLATEIMVAVVFSVAARATALAWPRAAAVVGTVTALGVAGLMAYALSTMRAASASPSVYPGGTPDSVWKWGVFYANPEDKGLLVPKRHGLGYTLNFAHGRAYALLLGLLLFAVGLVYLARLAGRE
jgi:uncharacterized membrane protein